MPKTYGYMTVDVFTDRAFAGNPVAVVADARGLSAEQMQQVAAEFDYSETTFVLPPEDASHTARVRIFTPRDEIGFAGHPNLGTAFALAVLAERAGKTPGSTLLFEEGAGLVPVDLLRDDGGRVSGARLTAPQPLALGSRVPPAVMAACAGLAPDDVITSRHEPVIASVGLPFAIAEVREEALGRVAPSVEAFARAAERYPSRSLRFSIHLYARPGGGAGGPDLRARMFAPLSGVPEDPVTGSANGALGALLATLSPEREGALTFDIVQGVELGRPGRLTVTVEKKGGAIARVQVAGGCVAVMEGTFAI